MELSQAVKERIIKLSKNKNTTLHKLSLDAGISYSTLSSFMNGKCKTPNLSTILHICEGLNIDLFEFFQDEIFKNVKDE